MRRREPARGTDCDTDKRSEISGATKIPDWRVPRTEPPIGTREPPAAGVALVLPAGRLSDPGRRYAADG